MTTKLTSIIQNAFKKLIFRKARCIKLVIYVIGSFSASGCIPIVATYGVGQVALSRERSPVYVTENEKEVTGCNFVKSITASSSWGGLLLQEKALQRVISDLTHEASQAGANVLLIRSKSKTFMGSSGIGDAYRCKNVGPGLEAGAAKTAGNPTTLQGENTPGK